MITREPRPSDALALIHTSALLDGALSFKARGILAYLLASPPGQSISPNTLAKSGTDGDRAIKSGLTELEDAGYLTRTVTADEDNPTVTLTVTDTPGIGSPTPTEQAPSREVLVRTDRLMWLCEQHGWLSPAAVKTAVKNFELIDIPLSVTKYEIRCVELKKSPNSGEWLRWTIEDEQKLKLTEGAQAKEAGKGRHWWDVA